jgi:hypothetical protein
VTSPKERNRFLEGQKIFYPMLETDNYGVHSPNKIYDLTDANKKVSRFHIKRETTFEQSFPKAPRAIGVHARPPKNMMFPGPAQYVIESPKKLTKPTFGTSPRRIDMSKFHSIGTGRGSLYDGQVYKI